MTAGGQRIRRGVRLWTVAVSTFKSDSYRFLRLERSTDEELASGTTLPPATIHLPASAESEWCKQFVAEQLVTVKTKRGFQRLEWQKLRERNEALDCRRYAPPSTRRRKPTFHCLPVTPRASTQLPAQLS
jgi:phage terminase large subunit GpA-like protein